MKQFTWFIFLLSTGFASCEEPYFDKPFAKGEKLKTIPAELQGNYNIIMRTRDSKQGYDTMKEEFVYITADFMAYIKEDSDTIDIFEDEILFDIRKDANSLYKHGNVYYLNEEIKENDTAYYAVRQMRTSKAGLEHRFLDMDNDVLMQKLEKITKKLKHQKTDNSVIKEQTMVFKMDEDKLHKFFEKEVPDTLVVNLLRVK